MKSVLTKSLFFYSLRFLPNTAINTIHFPHVPKDTFVVRGELAKSTGERLEVSVAQNVVPNVRQHLEDLVAHGAREDAECARHARLRRRRGHVLLQLLRNHVCVEKMVALKRAKTLLQNTEMSFLTKRQSVNITKDHLNIWRQMG